ncbi:hypothetical protein UPYG_G00199120 [Umbra pygmaea]|uniref:PHD-type domain-containing protein n=1 Tax=Umbra pygmaea TaxID=75934 RepID=A0ABD0X5P1_UMBPY
MTLPFSSYYFPARKMSTSAASQCSNAGLCPNFAVVCSFLERYGPVLGLPKLTFLQMERYLGNSRTVPEPLVELHLNLLRNLGKSVSLHKWQRYLAKVCRDINSNWAWELKHRGYQDMSMEYKINILKYLCEMQFDDNLKFKTLVNEENAEAMRLQPVGRDQQGLMYWLQTDVQHNIRLYTEEQDDWDGSTWRCIVRTRNDLAEALELLKTQLNPECKKKTEEGGTEVDRDQGGNKTCCTKPVLMGKRGEEGKVVGELKEEDKKYRKNESEIEPAGTDNKERKPNGRFSKKTKQEVPPVKEEAARALTSGQQAKIPLKKRKLFGGNCPHSNIIHNNSDMNSNHQNNNSHSSNTSSSLIVCNPSVKQTKADQLAVSLPEEALSTVTSSQAVKPGAGHGVGDRLGPLDASELQKGGIQLKIKIPPQQRRENSVRKEQGEEQGDGRSLRRSARICRPNPKESQDPAPETEKDAGKTAQRPDTKADTEKPSRTVKSRQCQKQGGSSNAQAKTSKPNEGEERAGTDCDDSGQSVEMLNEDPCSHCGLSNHPELILLCHLCDSGYHSACLRPPPMVIPDGEWLCPPCQHKFLCERLEVQLLTLDSALKKRDRAERR